MMSGRRSNSEAAYAYRGVRSHFAARFFWADAAKVVAIVHRSIFSAHEAINAQSTAIGCKLTVCGVL